MLDKISIFHWLVSTLLSILHVILTTLGHRRFHITHKREHIFPHLLLTPTLIHYLAVSADEIVFLTGTLLRGGRSNPSFPGKCIVPKCPHLCQDISLDTSGSVSRMMALDPQNSSFI
jgi:hypothetical protein